MAMSLRRCSVLLLGGGPMIFWTSFTPIHLEGEQVTVRLSSWIADASGKVDS